MSQTVASNPSSALLECDVVFRGGITSGVVYPGTVARLAERYRFVQIGGASAGAIAAGAAAAAEYGRRRGNHPGAFAELAGLATEVSGAAGSPTNFKKLFRSHPKLWVLNRALWMFLSFGLWGGLLVVLSPALLAGFIAILLGVSVSTAILVALVVVATEAFVVLRQVLIVLPSVGFGLCSGVHSSIRQTAESLRSEGALSDWLHTTIQRLAGRTVGNVSSSSKPDLIPDVDRPLTMADLWGTHSPAEKRDIDLVLTTTNLSQQMPHQFPFLERRRLFFSPAELKDILPADVLNWMVAAAMRRQGDSPLKHRDFLPLPAPADLPVLLGVRMSLSFPGLIAAVPLYAEDYDDAITAKRALHPAAAPLRRCWFSDGGITSNFPIHIFDAPLPGRPTFCVNLRAATKAEREAPTFVSPPPNKQAGFAQAVGTNPLAWMARGNDDDIAPRFLSSIDNSLFAFISAIVDTARNGHENELMLLPGYRDRIVHVATKPEEGGLNLQMLPETVQALSDRGRDAADLLISRFDPLGAASIAGFRLNWQNHRWIRFRSTMAALERFLADFSRGWVASPSSGNSFKADSARWDPTNPQNQRSVPPGHRVTPGYPWASSALATAAADSTDEVVALAERMRRELASLSIPTPNGASIFDGIGGEVRNRGGAPRPKLSLKMRPCGSDPSSTTTYRP